MKKRLLAALLLGCLTVQAQKEDYIWYLGYLPNVPEEKFGGSKIDFHKSPPEISFFEIGLNLTPVGMICSPSGEVQFYSGGCSVANKENQIMANSEGINAGQIADVYCPIQGYPTFNGLLALPRSSSIGKYIEYGN